jgi:Flp pilus assembly pilin Flp
MLLEAVVRLIREEEGMEMVEWSIVGVIFAIACALVWGTMSANVTSAVGKIGSCVSNTSACS